MNEALIAVGFGDFRFSADDVAAAAFGAWAGAVFAPASGSMSAVSDGQLQLPVPEDDSEVLAGFLPRGTGISLDGTVEGMARFIAWITTFPGFPRDRSVMVLGWGPDEVPLDRNTSAEALVAAFSA